MKSGVVRLVGLGGQLVFRLGQDEGLNRLDVACRTIELMFPANALEISSPEFAEFVVVKSGDCHEFSRGHRFWFPRLGCRRRLYITPPGGANSLWPLVVSQQRVPGLDSESEVVNSFALL